MLVTALRDSQLPIPLRRLARPPAELYVCGELPFTASVAIVGTRHASPPAEQFAAELAKELVANGVVVSSGGAEGIDAAAHRGALEAGGVTLVVAPAGWERPFPKGHAKLFREVVACGGAYATLRPPDQPARRHDFLLRNRILVALADAVVVVEAPLKSGARNAALHARKLGRPLFVVPHAPWHDSGRGCVAELCLGATPLAEGRAVLQVLDALRRPRLGPGQPRARTEERPVDQIIHAIAAGSRLPEEICLVTGLPLSQVRGELLTLTLEGVLVADPSGCVKLRNPLK